MAEKNEQNPKQKNGIETFLEKIKVFWNDLTQDKNVENAVHYAKSNTRDMIAYILLLTGLLLMFFDPNYGGTLIGVIFGLYFSQELYDAFKNYEMFIQTQGFVKSLVFGAVLLAFFFSVPFIFIGAIAAVGVRRLLGT